MEKLMPNSSTSGCRSSDIQIGNELIMVGDISKKFLGYRLSDGTIHPNKSNYGRNPAVYEYYFESVEKLLYAIKHEPEKYNNARIKVIGTLQTGLESTLYDMRLVDYTITSDYIPSTEGVEGRYQFRKVLDKSASKIDIEITSDAQYAVAETGDYVKIYGKVRITRERIFIDDCAYDLIATLDERIQNISESN